MLVCVCIILKWPFDFWGCVTVDDDGCGPQLSASLGIISAFMIGQLIVPSGSREGAIPW